ncbi:hypothetical protein M0802_007867 [Mischocyttarus mexicanus]|nr:hypothetical protein M0802_007867 [Mischocyttarus mexicanus]
MHNWNQWQLPTGAITTSMPQPPVGYTTSGGDPMAMMQAYMQYYNQPAPNGYTAEQWAAAQQQNWAQWQQWQQQYQQWQAQYGEKYQETMKQMSSQNLNLSGHAPPLPTMPPLPKEDFKPPLPPNSVNTYQFTNIPPPHQNNLPLFPTKQPVSSAPLQLNVHSSQNPPLPPPLPLENAQSNDGNSATKRSSNVVSESCSAKKLKNDDEELTDAEKTFDAQFKQWEEQFNDWKQQNINHPDKEHYKIYEAKWTSWREKLIERREMMRKKREQQKQLTTKADTEKAKNLPGGDKIMNILSSTENQGLINNLLGIGKTLGLTGKQSAGTLPPPPPPPQTTSNISSTTVTPAITTQQSTPQPLNTTDTVSSWNAQQAAQWAAQFNSGMQNYSGFHNTPGSTQQSFGVSMHPPNFALPPPNMPNATPNFLQPPPGFNNDGRQQPDTSVRPNLQNRSSYGSSGNNLNMFGANEKASSDVNRFGSNDPLSLPDYSGNFDAIDNSTNDRMNNRKGPLGSTGPEYFRREVDKNLSEHNHFRSDGLFNYGNVRFNRGDENYKSVDETDIDGKNYNKPEERNFMERGNNQLNTQNNFNSINSLNNDCFNIDRSGSGPSDRFGSGSVDRFGNSNDRFSDRFGPNNPRFGSNNARFGSGNDRFGPSSNRFGPLDHFGSRNERFGQGSGLESDRFGSGFDHFSASSTDNAGPGNNRFARNLDHFEQNKGIDSARDNNNPRNFERSNQIGPSDELAPELKKLMEKRRAAMDVFKPSFYDSDKIVNVGSLRESFKKIAGDSPFLSKSSTDFGQRDFGLRGMATYNPRFSGNFEPQNNPRFFGPRGPNDFKPHSGNFDFRLRGHVNFSPRDKAFDYSHDPNSSFLRESTPNFSKFDKNQSMFGSVDVDQRIDQRIDQQYDRGDPKLQQMKDMQNSGLSDDNVPVNTDNILTEKRADIPVHKDETDNTVKAKEVSQTEKIEEESSNNIADTQSNTQEDKSTCLDVLPLEKPPWVDTSFPDVNLSKKEVNNTECNTKSSSNLTVPTEENNEKIDEKVQAEHQSDEKLESNAPPENEEIKNSEVLPFMGENDPKPEDLNMEPPPELPNLGPITDDLNNDNKFVNNPKIKEPFGADRNFVGELERNTTKFFPDPKNSFSPRGPPNDGRFLQQLPNNGQFSSLGPNDIEFRSRASMGGQLGIRGLNNRNFGPWRMNEMPCNNRGFTDTQFGPRGPIDRLSNITNINERNFNNRRSMDGPFDPQCSNDGPFASGQFSHHNLQDRMLANRELIESHFDIRITGLNTKLFGPRGLFENLFESQGISNEANTRSYNNRLCSNRSPFGNKPSGALDSGNNDVYQDKFNENYLDRKLDIGITDTGSSIESKLNSELDKMNKSDCKSFFQSNFNDTASRSQYGPDCPINLSSHEFKTNIHSQISSLDKKILEKSGIDSNIIGDSRIGYGDVSGGLDYKYNNSPAFMKRPIDNSQSYMRNAPNKEFYIERQFNYNHGGATKDKKYTEHVPVKVIDYAHAPRTITQEHLTPVQCFDYGHGKLKPIVSDHELLPKRDFRNWEESEQNLKEYIEKMKTYESSIVKHEDRRKTTLNESKESDWTANIRKYERGKRNADEKKERECSQEEQIYPDMSDKEREESKRIQSDKIDDKDKGHERCELVQADISKENDRENDRSKGHTNWQENSNKNTVETKSSNTSFTEKQQNVSESPSKTLELGKTANSTMVDDLLCPPGRQNRPSKIIIILRGPPGSGKSFVAKLIKDKEVEQGGSAPRILSLDDYFLVEKEVETKDDNGKKVIAKEMVYEYEEAMEPSYIVSLVKAFKKNITDGFFNFIILDCINEKISDYEDMWTFAKSKGFKVYVCEMEMDVQICLKRNIHNRSEDEINRIVDYFEPTPSYHQKLDVNSMLQEQAIEEVQMEDSQEMSDEVLQPNEESQDSQDDAPETIGISKWERMEAEDKLDRLDGLARKKNESKPQTMEDFLQVPDYYNMEDTSGKKRVRWADLEERKQQEKMRAVGFVVGHTNWDRMMDPTKGGSALTRTKYI